MKVSDADALRTRAFTGLVAHPERVPSDLLEVALAASTLPGTALTSRTMLHAVTTIRGLRGSLWMREEATRLHDWLTMGGLGLSSTCSWKMSGRA